MVGLLISAVFLGTVHRVTPSPNESTEFTALLAATGVATVARFLLLHRWVFRRRETSTEAA